MSLEYIYITRHGFRPNWTVDPVTGEYTGLVRSPMGHAADPALTSHGVSQSRELAAHLGRLAGQSTCLDAPIERIYSSPYYRCLQTLQPFVQAVAGDGEREREREREHEQTSPWWAVRCDPGLVDWFGPAPFEQPVPAPVRRLHDQFFPWIDLDYRQSGIVPRRHGETVAQLHARVAATLSHIIRQCDAEGVRAIVLCTHAATIIAMGRALTGQLPGNVASRDFAAFTCGLSTFRRRRASPPCPSPRPTGGEKASTTPGLLPDTPGSHVPPWDDPCQTLAGEAWIGGRGVEGGWDCVENSDCGFLSNGKERGWYFSGDDEAFDMAASATAATGKTTSTATMAIAAACPTVGGQLELSAEDQGAGVLAKPEPLQVAARKGESDVEGSRKAAANGAKEDKDEDEDDDASACMDSGDTSDGPRCEDRGGDADHPGEGAGRRTSTRSPRQGSRPNSRL
ncbi:C6 zinc cluster transcription factor-like protein [Sporothrix epigloea]|uniref:C6 zinc cluster transcription factor-like protein n=1 Tax=Sporothrix epigloea TaxID=1892477 RepID=A0ABP0DLT5_9PEZI